MGFRNAPVARKLRTAPSGPRVEITSDNAETVEWFTGHPSEQLPAQAYVAVDGTRHTGQLFLRPPSLRPHELPTTYLLLEGTSYDGSPSPTVAGGWTIGGQGTVTYPINGPDVDWSALSLNTPAGWAQWDAGVNRPSVILTSAGLVALDGIVKTGGSFASGFASTCAKVPPGYEPSRLVTTPCSIITPSGTWQATGMLQIDTAGNVVVTNTSGIALAANYGFSLNVQWPKRRS